MLFSGIECQPKVKDKLTLTCNPGAGPRLGHEMVYRINEGIQYCMSLCLCLLSVLQVFNEGGSVRKEERGEGLPRGAGQLEEEASHHLFTTVTAVGPTQGGTY